MPVFSREQSGYSVPIAFQQDSQPMVVRIRKPSVSPVRARVQKEKVKEESPNWKNQIKSGLNVEKRNAFLNDDEKGEKTRTAAKKSVCWF